MESPVVVENCSSFGVPNTDETGFPFDDTDYDSSDHFQSRLNDLAQRHPEFGNLSFESFPTWRRKRYGSNSSSDREDPRPHTPGHSSSSFDAPEARRFADHSFPSGFNRFPFTRHFDNFDDAQTEEKPPEVPRSQEKRGRKVNPNLPQHLSNTVDLGQKQAPVEENRSQRSMSAPPENRTAHNTTSRFDTDPSRDDPRMGGFTSRARTGYPSQGSPQPQAQPSAPKERVIPIFVEGRDEPLIPKNVNTEPEKPFFGEQPFQNRGGNVPSHHFNQDQFQKPQQGFMQQPRPQQFTAPDSANWQQAPPSQQAQPTKQQTPAQAKPATKQAPPQEDPPTEPQVAKNLNDPLEKIKSVKNDVLELMGQVQKFQGTRKDKYYIYLDEMLTRNLLKLDNVETEGKENIRLARREAIKCIQECINKLEAQAQAFEKHTERAELEVTVDKTEPADDSEKIIESEQKHAKETQKPVYRSEATILVQAAGDVPDKNAENCPEKMEVESVTIEPVIASAMPISEAEPSPAVEETAIVVGQSTDTTTEISNKSSEENPDETQPPSVVPITSLPADIAN